MVKKKVKPELSIIIVSWNCLDYLEKCLQFIEKARLGWLCETILIDNASQDGTVEKIREDYPWVRLISHEQNLGFPRAVNQGLKEAAGNYILLLNPDVEFEAATLEKSLEAIKKDPQIGLLGVKIKRPDGRIQLHSGRRFPSLFSLICNSLGLDRALARLKILPSVDLSPEELQQSREVDMISGTFMLFRREIYDTLGGLNETLPMYFEDMEFCWRVKKSGWKVYYFAEAEIIHQTGISSSRANPLWITGLKYEANRLMLKTVGKKTGARIYPFLIFLLAPLRYLLFPLWSFSLKRRGLEAKPSFYLKEVTQAWLWSAKACKQGLKKLFNKGVRFKKI